MTRRQMSSDLTPEAVRFLDRVRTMDPPPGMVDRVMAEVRATAQQEGRWLGIGRPLLAAAAAAVLLLGAVLVWQFARQRVGPQPSPQPSAAAVQQVPSLATYLPAVFAHGYLWLDDPNRGELIRFDPQTGTLSDPLPINSQNFGSSVSPIAGPSSIWAVDAGTHELVEVDPATNTELRRVSTIANIPGGVFIADGFAWIADPDAQKVVTVDLVNGTVQDRFPLPDLGPARDFVSVIWVDRDAVWIGVPTSQITKLDATTGEIEQRISVPLAPFGAVAVGDQLLVNGSPAFASVDRQSGKVTGTIGDIRNAVLPVICEDGAVWVIRDDQLQRLDPVTLRVNRSITIGYTDFAGAACGGGYIWAATANTENNGLMLKVAIGN